MRLGKGEWGLALVGIVCALASCAGPEESNGGVLRTGADPRAIALRIEPAEVRAVVPLEGAAPAPIGFKVFVREQAPGGPREVDVTAEAAVTFEGGAIGRLDRTSFVTEGVGGRGRVIASARGLRAESRITLTLTGDRFESVAPSIKEAFAAPLDPTRPPEVDYPLAGSVFPANLPPPEIQWGGAARPDAPVRIDLTSPDVLDVHVYTTGRALAPAVALWTAAARSTVDDRLDITVHTVEDGHHFASAPRSVVVTADTVGGVIFTHTPGKLEIFDFLAGTETPLATDNADHQPGKCAGCHNVSHDARRIGFGRPPDEPNGGATLHALRTDTAGAGFSTTLAAAARSPATAFNPLESTTRPAMLAALAGGREDGLAALGLVDPDDGNVVPSNLPEVLAAMPGELGPGSTMPAWSRAGDVVVFAAYATDVFPGVMAGARMKQATLVELSVAFEPAERAFRFGAPRVLLAPGAEESFHRPTISADAAAVAFTNEASIAGVTTRSTEIVRRSDGHRFRIAAGAAGPKSSWATRSPDWSPDAGARYTWVVVDSSRPYGHRTGEGTALGPRHNLWMFAVDRARLERGTVDPAAAPLWIPGQRLEESYARPQWRRLGG